MLYPHGQRPVSREEEHHLVIAWQERGDRAALDRLVTSNIGLVVRIARQYRRAVLGTEELVQQGMLGLVIAMQPGHFDPFRHIRLSTYAMHWVRAMMYVAMIEAGSVVKFGTTARQRRAFWLIGRAQRAVASGGKEVTTTALAEYIGVDVPTIDRVLANTPDVSLDAPISRGDADGTRLHEVFADSRPIAEELFERSEDELQRHVVITRGLARLTPREKDVIERRYLRKTPQTLQQVGDRYNLSRERVRQLEQKALKKLRGTIVDVG